MPMTTLKLLLPLLAVSSLSGCDRQNSRGDANSAPDKQSAAAPDPDRCIEGLAITVGDKNVELTLAGTKLHWDASGTVLKLSQGGSGRNIELVPSTYIGGPSLKKGDCLRSGGYIRFADGDRTDPNRYLQAFQQADPDNVLIGNYPDPQLDSIFNIVKDPEAAGNSPGFIIRKNDLVHIRGVSRDPWLVAPANATSGSEVGLIDWSRPGDATAWKITREGSPADPGS